MLNNAASNPLIFYSHPIILNHSGHVFLEAFQIKCSQARALPQNLSVIFYFLKTIKRLQLIAYATYGFMYYSLLTICEFSFWPPQIWSIL